MTSLRTRNHLPRHSRWQWMLVVLGLLGLQLNLAGHVHPAGELGPDQYHCTICVGPALPQSSVQPLSGAELAPIYVAFRPGSDATITRESSRSAHARAPPLS